MERFGEDARFTPYKDLPNRKLLWHGSRLVNFSKILAQVRVNFFDNNSMVSPNLDLVGYYSEISKILSF